MDKLTLQVIIMLSSAFVFKNNHEIFANLLSSFNNEIPLAKEVELQQLKSELSLLKQELATKTSVDQSNYNIAMASIVIIVVIGIFYFGNNGFGGDMSSTKDIAITNLNTISSHIKETELCITKTLKATSDANTKQLSFLVDEISNINHNIERLDENVGTRFNKIGRYMSRAIVEKLNGILATYNTPDLPPTNSIPNPSLFSKKK
jgi:hypothetical protein